MEIKKKTNNYGEKEGKRYISTLHVEPETGWNNLHKEKMGSRRGKKREGNKDPI